MTWQDEISSELALVKGKVDSILSDSEVTVQVRKFAHHHVVQEKSRERWPVWNP